MKNVPLYLLFTFFIFGSTKTYAQAFSIQKDTVRLAYIAGSGLQNVADSIAPLISGSVIEWKVIATDFPTDWQATKPGLCDNRSCYSWGLLWPAASLKTSYPYTTTTTHDFHLQINLDGDGSAIPPVHAATTPGTYYIVANLKSGSTDTNQVYAVSFTPSAVPTVSKVSDEVSLYPNPTNNDINVVYDANADIKTISVYNIIGKAMAIYKPISDNSANLSLENVPAGIYFVRLINSRGEVVTTKKFTKQ